ncbi:MAG: hypothetical protein ABGX70_05475, partial [Psychrobacter sp.]
MAIDLLYSDVCSNINIEGGRSRSKFKEVKNTSKIINGNTYLIKLSIRAHFYFPFKAANSNPLKKLPFLYSTKISPKTSTKQVDTKIKPSIIRPHQTDWRQR